MALMEGFTALAGVERKVPVESDNRAAFWTARVCRSGTTNLLFVIGMEGPQTVKVSVNADLLAANAVVEEWFDREVRIEAGGEYSALTIRFAEFGYAVVEW